MIKKTLVSHTIRSNTLSVYEMSDGTYATQLSNDNGRGNEPYVQTIWFHKALPAYEEWQRIATKVLRGEYDG